MTYSIVFSIEATQKIAEIDPQLAADFLDFFSMIESNPERAGVRAYFRHRPQGRMVPFKTIIDGELLYCFIFFRFQPGNAVLITKIVAGTRD